MNRIREFLAEDVGDGDITSDILIGRQNGKAHITAGVDCTLAGLEEAAEVFGFLGLEVILKAADGQKVTEGAEVMVISGELKKILMGERLALNFLMHMSGIATATRAVMDECRLVNGAIHIAATRKTTPGFRVYEKKAVRLGGGDPHRARLDDGILIKDNHLAVVGSITEAVTRAKSYSFAKKVEVEVESLNGAQEAAKAGADIIMLDNMTPSQAKAAYTLIKGIDKRIVVEVSGGITPSNAPEYAAFADIISMGWITHSAPAVQFSLHIV
ncbi:MAG: nicotinate-nucleotide pyrophosphorylase [Methanomassiliicoccales archaeon PtaU1.Bin124]|nr:MAG: nicotinate-nucleotide pyrophosphorylase [Methanomassiliicoccales archaeon PtaU1.Bin124]